MSTEQQRAFVREKARAVPVVAEVDVLVAGGGPAGFGAALAAAREGASTLLIERHGFLGGVATAALVSKFSQHKHRLYGLADEMVDEMVRRGGATVGAVINFDPECFKEVALELVEAAGVRLLLYSWAVAPLVEGGVVRGAIAENKSGRQAILARTTIDCTGDADLSYRAGVPWTKGRQSDGKMRPITLAFRMGNIDFRTIVAYARAHPQQFSPDPNFQVNDIEHGVVRISGFFDLVAEGKRRGELFPDCNYLRLEGVDVRRGICFVNNTRVYQVDGSDAWDLTKAEVEARRQIRQLASFIQKRVPGCDNAFVLDTAPSLGVRETRRIVGQHVLTEEDVVAGGRFPDRVVRVHSHLAAPGVEIHDPDGDEGSAVDTHAREIVHEERGFFIPYRSLLPQKVAGLLVAGRCISQTHEADKWTRNEVWCIEMGQAAGTAGAVAARAGVDVRAVDVAAIQGRLLAQGVPLELPLQAAPLPATRKARE